MAVPCGFHDRRFFSLIAEGIGSVHFLRNGDASDRRDWIGLAIVMHLGVFRIRIFLALRIIGLIEFREFGVYGFWIVDRDLDRKYESSFQSLV